VEKIKSKRINKRERGPKKFKKKKKIKKQNQINRIKKNSRMNEMEMMSLLDDHNNAKRFSANKERHY